ncbi:MAG: hypothetical protein M9897_14055 [Brumimicrobium sp.]|nr:hypothetical protein [Brumimicrobium sp.]
MRKNYSPFHIILFITICLSILGGISLLVPSGKLKIAGYDFRFISQNKLHKIDTRKKVDLKDIVVDIDTTIIDNTDSIDTTIKVLNFNINVSQHLEYNNTAKETFKTFFTQLHLANSKKVRILHYGDSQIEGDRFTSFLRQRLQEQFGGYGPGFIPAVNTINSMSFTQTYSPNFIRYTNYGGGALKQSSNYGILNTVGRFTPEDTIKSVVKNDSIKSLPPSKAWVEIIPGKVAFGRSKVFTNIYMHYTDAYTKCLVKVFVNGENIRNDSLISDGKYHIYTLNLATTPENVRFEFEAVTSPTFLGYSLEGGNGILVDNIAMRGSSGTFFGKINQGLAKRIYDEQNVDLFIMQFGGNSVPYIKDSTDAANMASFFKGQLQVIKRLRPNAAIIVIGPSDMSTLVEGEYTTYPILPYYIECMKKRTKEVGGAYFDLYEAMGGKDAMVAWVENDLAANDYIHFSVKGAKIAAQKFYDAFMAAYTKIMNDK